MVTVRFFASLREELGRPDASIEAEADMKVIDVWRRVGAGRPLPADVLAAVNLNYVGREHPVGDGDEVAFFPPVTGG